MKTSVNSSILRCALGLLLSATCSLMAQAPAGGGATQSGTGRATGTTGTRTGTTTTGTNATGTNATGTTTRTNGTTTNATGTNAAPTNTTITNPNGTVTNPNGTITNPNGTVTSPNGTVTSPNGAVTGTNTVGTNATRTAGSANTTGTANQTGTTSTAGTTSLPAGTLTSEGTITNFGANDFSLQGNTTTSPNATPSDFLIGADTLFLDSFGNAIPRERFFRRGSKVPASVSYTRSPDGRLIASRVVLNETEATSNTAPVESAGTITEVSPGILVIEQPGASDTPVRYVNNKTTNYVNENGEPVPPESVKAGTPVKIFYTKVGDTLVASRVEVHSSKNGGLPKPVVPAERTSTRPAKDLPR